MLLLRARVVRGDWEAGDRIGRGMVKYQGRDQRLEGPLFVL